MEQGAPGVDGGVEVFRQLSAWLTAQVPAEVRPVLDPHLEETAARLHRMYRDELLAGYRQDPATLLGIPFEDAYDEMVVVCDIPFYSLCAHHLLAFFGKAHLGYIPNGRIVGLSKLARLVDCFARRLQIQERMTAEIAAALQDVLRPRGVGCVVEAEHLCMGCRGVSKSGTRTVTSALLGEFREEASTRAEFLSLAGVIGRGGASG